jgi:peptide/nickel transport system ATP-binding protein
MAQDSITPLLEVKDLTVSFPTFDGVVRAVRGASFYLNAGETLAIVGESGSGKSVCTQALIGLVPGADIGGEAVFDGVDLFSCTEKELREIRGRRIGLVFQDPLTSLHPLYTVGWQLAEGIRVHQRVSRKVAHRRAIELLKLVGIPQPEQRVNEYPHQFSGGMRQRVLIAMAVALEPEILIADEPTTALDATIQAQILELLVSLQGELGMAMIFVTHDLGVVADLADRVMVMYAGKPVEIAQCRDAYYSVHHPYTKGLLASVPVAGSRARLRTIPGQPPSLLTVSGGCSFSPRCEAVMDRCAREEPPLRLVSSSGDHLSACWLPDLALASPPGASSAGGGSAPSTVSVEISMRVDPVRARAMATDSEAPPPILVADGIVKYFPVGGQGLLRGSHGVVHAVDGVSFYISPGETLGLVGESGCGKSTLARCLAMLYPLTAGQIEFEGKDLGGLPKDDQRRLRRSVQMVFQDPYGSLNPRRRVGSIIGEALRVHGIGSHGERTRAVQEIMEIVGLNPEHFNRYPAEFSGGQRQRIGIARSLVVRPKLLICDEPVSALDVSVRAQIINLLSDLRDEFSLTTIFISHDLGVVEQVSDRVAVMYLGQIVEMATSESLYAQPRHPYTAALLSAATVADPDLARGRKRIILAGDVPSPSNPPSGCRFHPRCPRAQARCASEAPTLTQFADNAAHVVACHYPLESKAAA